MGLPSYPWSLEPARPHNGRVTGTFRAQPRANSTFLLTSLMMEPTSLMESTNLMMEPIVERLRTFKR